VQPKTIIWRKENLINLAVQDLNEDDCFAWIDSDIVFSRHDWARATLELLEKVDVVQMFSQIIWLSKRREASIIFNGIIAEAKGEIVENQFINVPEDILNDPNILPGHPGFAWAMTKTFWNKIHGFYDKSIVGGADAHFAYALLDKSNLFATEKSVKDYFNYRLWCGVVKSHAAKFDFLQDAIIHNWHGSLEKRQYAPRKKILIDAQYDPVLDIEYVDGVLELTERGMRLQPAIKEYFSKRSSQ
jgi:hypothetical protein